MRVIQAWGGLPRYYDRPGENQWIYVSLSNEPPHGDTIRSYYKVPEGKKAFIVSAYMRVICTSVPSTPNIVQMVVSRYKGPGYDVPIIGVSMVPRNPLDMKENNATNLGVMLAGEEVRIRTRDGSTGGTESYWCAVCFYEFT